MFDIDKWQEIFHTLRKNKLRTILTGFGVFWGIFMLMIMLGAGKGLENGIYANMGDFATNSMFIWTQPTSMPYKGFQRNRRYFFKYEDMAVLRDRVKGIDLIVPYIQAGGYGQSLITSRKDRKGTYSVSGLTPDANKIDPVDIQQGRFVNQLDLDEKRKVAVIGRRVFDELFGKDEKAINQYIRIGSIYYQVIGVFNSKHTGQWGDNQNQEIFIPFTTCQLVYNYNNIVGNFSITGHSHIDMNELEKEVKTVLAELHSIHPDDTGAFGCANVGMQFKKMNGLFIGINGLVWMVGIGTLLAGIIGISNIMLIIIKERTQEIGVKRAIGASPINIIGTVITESVFLTGLSGLLGMFVGISIIELIAAAIGNTPSSDTVFLNPNINFNIALLSLSILVLSGVFAGIIPARRAIAIKPIDALRSE